MTSVTRDLQVTRCSHASHVRRGVTSPGGTRGDTTHATTASGRCLAEPGSETRQRAARVVPGSARRQPTWSDDLAPTGGARDVIASSRHGGLMALARCEFRPTLWPTDVGEIAESATIRLDRNGLGIRCVDSEPRR